MKPGGKAPGFRAGRPDLLASCAIFRRSQRGLPDGRTERGRRSTTEKELGDGFGGLKILFV
jgi:hypothetical protein